MAIWNPKTKKWSDDNTIWNPKTQQWAVAETKKNTDKETTTVKKKKDSWFEAGAFGDDKGNIFTDTLSTVGSTVGDIGTSALKGASDVGLRAAKLTAGGIAQVADWTGNDKYADKVRNKIAGKDKETNKKLANYSLSGILTKANKAVEGNSVLGEKADQIIEGLGGYAAMAAGQAVGIPWQLTAGMSTAGEELGTAYAHGATDKEAWTSAGISATAEILTEYISGGLKLKGTGKTAEQLTGGLVDKIQNKLVKGAVGLGINMAGEGTEEVLSGYAQAIGQNLTYMDDKQLKELHSSKDALDDFVAGALVSGVAAGASPRTYQNIKSGRNLITGYTSNEQSVIDKETETRTKEAKKQKAIDNEVDRIIKEKGKSFGQLTTSEKNHIKNNIKTNLQNKFDNGEFDFSTTDIKGKELKTIQDQVKSDLAKGNISIDTIESTFTDKTDTIKKLNKQLETEKDINKANGIRKEIMKLELAKNSELKGKFTNDGLLQNSYREEALRGQKFNYEVKDTDSEYRKNLAEDFKQKGNNSTKSHETFEMLSKIAEDKKTNYGITTNEELKELGYDIEGKDVNGLVRIDENKNQKVMINIDSPRAINRILGHETTHLLEGSEKEFNELKQFAKDYADINGEYNTRLKETKDLYKGTNANIENEVTADIVGDYLFTDTDFVNKLSTEKPNIFQKVYDEVKHLYKLATAGSEEARKLEKLKKSFEKAYKQNVSITEQSVDKLSLGGELANKSISKNIQLKIAKGMQEKNLKRDIIWAATGWEYDNVDGKWKYELPDAKIKENLDIKLNEDYKLADVLEAKKLFKAYPQLKEYSFGIVDMSSKEAKELGLSESLNGSFIPEDKVIIINKNNANPNKTLVHEIQHAIQNIEGFSVGTTKNEYIQGAEDLGVKISNNKAVELYKRTAGEVEARNAADRSELSPIDRMLNRPAKTRDTKENNIIKVEDLNNAIDKKNNETKEVKYSISKKTGQLIDSDGNGVKLETSSTGTSNNLMAIHNLNAAKLKGIMELGGFPVPSIAIMRPDITNLNYGEISVLFDKNTIDPSNKANEVYASDVYSKRFPKTIQKVNEKELSKLQNYLGDRISIDNTTLEDTKQKSIYNKSFINKFLEENNIKIDNIYKQAELNYINNDEAINSFIINKDLTYEKMLNNKELRNKFYELYKESVPFKAMAERKIETWEKIFNQGGNENTSSRFNNDFNSIKNGREQVLDEIATSKSKRDIVLGQYEEQYNKFIEDKLLPVFEDKYIRNDKDFYTSSGNSRSFNQLYDKYNLDNIVKNMKGKVRGEEGFFYGAGNIRSQVTPQFKSIADIKANEGKLVTNTEMESVKDDINSTLKNLSETAKSFGGYTYDSYEYALNDIAKLKKITNDKAKEVFKENGYENVPDILVDKSIDFLEKLKNAPTDYFEAKPQRALGFDEVQAIVIPNNIDTDLKQKLMDNGLNIVEYDPNVEGDRRRVINQFDDLKFSLSNKGQEIAPSRNDVFGSDIKYKSPVTNENNPDVTGENIQNNQEIAPAQQTNVDYAPLANEDLPELEKQYNEAPKEDVAPVRNNLTQEESQELDSLEAVPFNLDEDEQSRVEELNKIEKSTPEEEKVTSDKSLFETRDYKDVGSKKVKAYQYENPEVRPYFQDVAKDMLYDLENTTKGERIVDANVLYETNGEAGVYGTKRSTTEDIAAMLDGIDGKLKLSYAEIDKGLKAIIEDHGAENIASAKRIEFYLDQRLRNGYTTLDGYKIAPNQEYLNKLSDIDTFKGIEEAYQNWTNTLNNVEAPAETEVENNIAPTKKEVKKYDVNNEITKQKYVKDIKIADQQVAKILDEKPTKENNDKRFKAMAVASVVDKGYYISKLARETNNRQLDALWDNTLLSSAQAQEIIGEGRYIHDSKNKTSEKVGSSVNEIFEKLGDSDRIKKFSDYVYNKLNVERMSLESNANVRRKELRSTTLNGYTEEQIKRLSKSVAKEDASQKTQDIINAAKEYTGLSKVKNKPVFGYSVTADDSIQKVADYENAYPEFIDIANEAYKYESGEYSDLSALVDSGILSQKDADYYRNKYNSYVPIIRDIDTGMLEGTIFNKRTGTKNPVKSATGGNENIIPLKDAMAIKTMLVQKSANMNKLGLELYKTLNPKGIETETMSTDKIIEDISSGKDIVQAGTNGKAPTMTVYENGEKITFEIPDEIYQALKTNQDSLLNATIKPLNAFSNFKRGVLTQYNPFFMVTNAIKDSHDILINSQHALSTYKSIPEAIAQLSSKGYFYREMQSQGLFQDTYYDNKSGFDTEKKGLAKITDFYPLAKIDQINDFIERVPRMAEYIASRKAGRSVEVSSLDASRVTTNFKAGGDLTKFINRNGFTFLNASVQGAVQNVRNIQEAHMKGLKGYLGLATRFAVAALPAALLNGLLWKDDDDYEELNDYIKDNYYIVGKYGDGQYIRIPKGRMTAVIQKGLQEMNNLVTGDDEADLSSFLEILVNNLAPSNPLENNVLSPFVDTKLFNKDDPGRTWYGTDLVPTSLQDKPAKEQYDETTDEFSKWLGDKLNLSPIKINNLIDQNTGVIGDMLLPMGTTEAKTKNDNPIVAATEDKFTADKVFDNKYSSELYDVKDKLTKSANSVNATDKDKLKLKYMNSAQKEISKINKQIDDIQKSDLSKKEKYSQVRDLKEQANNLSKDAINTYKKLKLNDNYAKIGEEEYYKDTKNKWKSVSDKEKIAINSLGMSNGQKSIYFKAKNEISEINSKYKDSTQDIKGSYEDNEARDDLLDEVSAQKKREVVGVIKNSGLSDKAKAYVYGKNYGSETVNAISNAGININDFLDYSTQNFESDYNAKGKAITNSRKNKVIRYVNQYNMSAVQKAILIKSTNSFKFNNYNRDIINYVSNLNISYQDKVSMLKKIDMKVDSNGNVKWK